MKLSANQFQKTSFVKADAGFGGDNITSDPLGFDSPDGNPFGVGELGGIRHFQNRTEYTVPHQ